MTPQSILDELTRRALRLEQTIPFQAGGANLFDWTAGCREFHATCMGADGKIDPQVFDAIPLETRARFGDVLAVLDGIGNRAFDPANPTHTSAAKDMRILLEDAQRVLQRASVSTPPRTTPLPVATHPERNFMEMAISEARKCIQEPGPVRPLVGAVVVRDGILLGQAHRGELRPGDHAEYTLLEKKLGSDRLAGATVFTTLEPCTVRGEGKRPCVQRLVDRKIARVVIGTLDPNPDICGEGIHLLRERNIEVELFPAEFMSELEDLNREFIARWRSVRRGRRNQDDRLRRLSGAEREFLRLRLQAGRRSSRTEAHNECAIGLKEAGIVDLYPDAVDHMGTIALVIRDSAWQTLMLEPQLVEVNDAPSVRPGGPSGSGDTAATNRPEPPPQHAPGVASLASERMAGAKRLMKSLRRLEESHRQVREPYRAMTLLPDSSVWSRGDGGAEAETALAAARTDVVEALAEAELFFPVEVTGAIQAVIMASRAVRPQVRIEELERLIVGFQASIDDAVRILKTELSG